MRPQCSSCWSAWRQGVWRSKAYIQNKQHTKARIDNLIESQLTVVQARSKVKQETCLTQFASLARACIAHQKTIVFCLVLCLRCQAIASCKRTRREWRQWKLYCIIVSLDNIKHEARTSSTCSYSPKQLSSVSQRFWAFISIEFSFEILRTLNRLITSVIRVKIWRLLQNSHRRKQEWVIEV